MPRPVGRGPTRSSRSSGADTVVVATLRELLPNLRDLGGLPTGDGRRVAQGRLLRSDGLQRLTAEQRARVVEGLGVRTLIDLRSELERGRTGEVEFEIGGDGAVHRVPILDGSYMQAAAEGLSLTHMFDAITFDETAALAEAAGLVAAGPAPVLVFCTAGKDRTGILVALLLDALGVDRSAIVDDFTASEAGVELVMQAFLANFDDDELPDIPAEVKAAPPELLRGLLDRVDERAGGARALLVAAGLDPAAFDGLETMLLEPASG